MTLENINKVNIIGNMEKQKQSELYDLELEDDLEVLKQKGCAVEVRMEKRSGRKLRVYKITKTKSWQYESQLMAKKPLPLNRISSFNIHLQKGRNWQELDFGIRGLPFQTDKMKRYPFMRLYCANVEFQIRDMNLQIHNINTQPGEQAKQGQSFRFVVDRVRNAFQLYRNENIMHSVQIPPDMVNLQFYSYLRSERKGNTVQFCSSF